ncbi:c-type cytochrome [Novosphingobium sp. YJ-S2-02]|uniref:C-type cytochrome n=2 Tax=Novosphingobium aureum TaxID=2792964 RepID=A0A931MJX5_9SPHN|nr:c-type cytochrome [Novosphingobium aureum]
MFKHAYRRAAWSAIGALAGAAVLGALPARAGGDGAVAGKALFLKRACSACHSLEAGRNLNGPTLSGVIGREAGSLEGYRYSPALAADKRRWDKARLDAWLADPRAVVPGTKMAIKVASPEERRLIIAYLAATGSK